MYLKASIYKDKYLPVDSEKASKYICYAKSHEKHIYPVAFIYIYILTYASIYRYLSISRATVLTASVYRYKHIHIDAYTCQDTPEFCIILITA